MIAESSAAVINLGKFRVPSSESPYVVRNTTGLVPVERWLAS